MELGKERKTIAHPEKGILVLKKPRKTLKKVILHDSKYITFWKWENYNGTKQMTGRQARVGEEESRNGQAE